VPDGATGGDDALVPSSRVEQAVPLATAAARITCRQATRMVLMP
jgi:hypothetical protein